MNILKRTMSTAQILAMTVGEGEFGFKNHKKNKNKNKKLIN